jgi:hypothetical protein
MGSTIEVALLLERVVRQIRLTARAGTVIVLRFGSEMTNTITCADTRTQIDIGSLYRRHLPRHAEQE